jgi:outer membrane protein OmpA-like peptidoglycan-associated protein
MFLRRSTIIFLALGFPALAGSDPAPQPAHREAIPITTLSGGLADDVTGSFAPNATLASRCPAAPSQPASAPRPVNQEMVIVDSWRRAPGDVEGISHVTPSPDGGVQTKDSGQEFFSDTDTEGRFVVHTRTLCAVDLADSSVYQTGLGDNWPEIFPGTTQFSLSSATLHLLRTTGEAPLDYMQYDWMSPPGVWVPIPYSGTLRRVEPADVPYPMIVDGQSVTLATLHAKGILEFTGAESLREQIAPERIKQTAEFYVLDDESKPISLQFKFGPLFQVQVVSIAYPKQAPQNALEHQLLEAKHAVVYGIYFDFNSDHVRAESQPVLKEIADAMTHNPAWKLSIDGHTDNIGGDAKNLDLSRRRSEAVQRALVEQYHLPIGRMTTSGYGASRPVDSNDTLAGRARNRRVELTRE